MLGDLFSLTQVKGNIWSKFSHHIRLTSIRVETVCVHTLDLYYSTCKLVTTPSTMFPFVENCCFVKFLKSYSCIDGIVMFMPFTC